MFKTGFIGVAISPEIADSDATSAVIFIPGILWIGAAGNNVNP
jgi:hypothetical protein